MATKNRNPYREGSNYHKIFEFIRKAQVVTRGQLLEAGFPVADVTVVLSPRAEESSTRGGDCRGNYSSQGHVYYMDKLTKKKGEHQKFRLRYRSTPLESRVRPLKKDVPSQKHEIQNEVEPVETSETSETSEMVATVEEVGHIG